MNSLHNGKMYCSQQRKPYAPKYALQFKQDLKNREKEDKKKNTNNHKNESSYLDGGEGGI